MTGNKSQKKFTTSNMKTFKVSRVGHNLDKDHSLYKPPFDFEFYWNNGEEETFIIVSLHGALKLAETFKSEGYKEEKDSIKFVKGLSY
jgi:hypothetical protein